MHPNPRTPQPSRSLLVVSVRPSIHTSLQHLLPDPPYHLLHIATHEECDVFLRYDRIDGVLIDAALPSSAALLCHNVVHTHHTPCLIVAHESKVAGVILALRARATDSVFLDNPQDLLERLRVHVPC